MVLQIDTREKPSELKRIQKQLDDLGTVKCIRSKLYIGDYMLYENPTVVIDRKKDLLELCGNVTQQHERFKRELLRALDAGIKIIVLVEHGKGIQSLDDVYLWENPRRKIAKWRTNKVTGRREKYFVSPKAVNGEQLYKSLCTIRDRYGVTFEFCTKEETGRRIVEILTKHRINDER